ncbi:hypothetical protein EPO34_04725 [Patescibacteria group bacterium]|nr:MAG: hypothetical protein EPO34_04725 [Patescibacteria group bacterium]
MKRLLPILSLIVLAGAGCFAPSFEGTAYENAEYGFAFNYPSDMEVRTRPDDVRETQYLGLDVDFFATLRDTVKEAKPLNIAAFYAVPGLTDDAFAAALTGSGAGIAVTSRESEKRGGIRMTKVVSTTESGEEKAHYLFDRDGKTIIVSVFLTQGEAFSPILETFRAYRP